jgi:hypothetical protein
MSVRFANAAPIDTVILGGRTAFSLSGMSRTDLAKLMSRSSLLSSSVVGHVTCLCSSPTAVARLGCARVLAHASDAVSVQKFSADLASRSSQSGVRSYR